MVIVCVSLLLSNTRIYTLNFSTHITHFSAVVAMEQKNFEQIFALVQANAACR